MYYVEYLKICTDLVFTVMFCAAPFMEVESFFYIATFFLCQHA